MSGTTPLPSFTRDDRQQFVNEIKTTTTATEVPAVTITTTIPFTISTRKPYAIENRQHIRLKSNNRDSNERNESGKLLDRPSNCDQDSTNIQCIPSIKYADSTTTPPDDEPTTAATPTTRTTQSLIYETGTELPDFPDLSTNRNIIEILTFKPPAASSSRSNLIESTRSGDSGHSNKAPLICRFGRLDPRCPNPTPTGTPPTYLPGSLDLRSDPRASIRKASESFTFRPSTLASTTFEPTTSPPTTEMETEKSTDTFFICVPGSNDYRCDDYSRKHTEDNEVITTTDTNNAHDIEEGRAIGRKKCTDDPRNPGCKRVTTDLLTLKARTTTSAPSTTEIIAEVTTEELTTENQMDTRTTHVPPTTDFGTSTRSVSTQQPQTTTIVTSSPSTIKPPVCYPGALDPRCKESKPFKPAPPQNMNSIISFGILNQQKNDVSVLNPTKIQSTPKKIHVSTRFGSFIKCLEFTIQIGRTKS